MNMKVCLYFILFRTCKQQSVLQVKKTVVDPYKFCWSKFQLELELYIYIYYMHNYVHIKIVPTYTFVSIGYIRSNINTSCSTSTVAIYIGAGNTEHMVYTYFIMHLY